MVTSKYNYHITKQQNKLISPLFISNWNYRSWSSNLDHQSSLYTNFKQLNELTQNANIQWFIHSNNHLYNHTKEPGSTWFSLIPLSVPFKVFNQLIAARSPSTEKIPPFAILHFLFCLITAPSFLFLSPNTRRYQFKFFGTSMQSFFTLYASFEFLMISIYIILWLKRIYASFHLSINLITDYNFY